MFWQIFRWFELLKTQLANSKPWVIWGLLQICKEMLDFTPICVWWCEWNRSFLLLFFSFIFDIFVCLFNQQTTSKLKTIGNLCITADLWGNVRFHSNLRGVVRMKSLIFITIFFNQFWSFCVSFQSTNNQQTQNHR